MVARVVATLGIMAARVAVGEVRSDREAAAAASSGKLHVTEHAIYSVDGQWLRIRCKRCGGRARHDADEIRCSMCARTLAWIGIAPVKDGPAALAAERSENQHWQAAKARWSGKRRCQAGHLVEGANTKPWGTKWGKRVRCLRCYLERHTSCPHGHEYTPENTKMSTTGRRMCIACRAGRKSS